MEFEAIDRRQGEDVLRAWRSSGALRYEVRRRGDIRTVRRRFQGFFGDGHVMVHKEDMPLRVRESLRRREEGIGSGNLRKDGLVTRAKGEQRTRMGIKMTAVAT